MIPAGLIFAQESIDSARANRDLPPFSQAWPAFEGLISDPSVINDRLRLATALALHGRLSGDAGRAAEASNHLERADIVSDSTIAGARRAFAFAQALACLYGTEIGAVRWRELLGRWLDTFAAIRRSMSDGLHERAWSALLSLCAGVLSDDADSRAAGQSAFCAIADTVHAHGYISEVVAGKDGGSLIRTLQTAQALVLAAEAGRCAGLDLWGYQRRGVSVMTAALYPLYYYYYPEQWPWEAAIEPQKLTRRARRALAVAAPDRAELETTKALFLRYGSFLEPVNRQAAQSVRAVTLILDELRPLTDLLGGGPVTLTHAVPPAPKRRGIFGR